jgi:hypothetical protein
MIIDATEFSGSTCTKKEYVLWQSSGGDVCWGVHVRNVGNAIAGYNTLDVLLTAGNGDIHNIEARVVPLKRGQDVWVPLKVGTVQHEGAWESYASTNVKSVSATIDYNGEVAESSETNNKFSKKLDGIGTGDECKFMLAPSSKIFVSDGKLNVNLFFWNAGRKMTCPSQTKPQVSVRVFRHACYDMGLSYIGVCHEPPIEIIPSYNASANSNTGDWSTASAVTQSSCNAKCQQECADPNSAKPCWAELQLRGPHVKNSAMFHIYFNKTLIDAQLEEENYVPFYSVIDWQ